MNIIKWPKPVSIKKKILKVAKGTVHTEAKKMRMITDSGNNEGQTEKQGTERTIVSLKCMLTRNISQIQKPK